MCRQQLVNKLHASKPMVVNIKFKTTDATGPRDLAKHSVAVNITHCAFKTMYII